MSDKTASNARRTRSAGDPQRSRAMRQFAIGMIGYTVVIVLEGVLFRSETRSIWLGLALAALPMALAVWAMAGWLAAVRTFDELQQRIFSEAGLIALGVTAVATFTYGFLENYVGLPRLSMFVVFPFMALCYTLSLPATFRRYR